MYGKVQDWDDQELFKWILSIVLTTSNLSQYNVDGEFRETEKQTVGFSVVRRFIEYVAKKSN